MQWLVFAIYGVIFQCWTRTCCHLLSYICLFSNTIQFVNDSKVDGQTYTVKGKYLHSQKVFCDLPPVDMSEDIVPGYEFVISVANDGIHFSDERTLLVYDSTCMTCTLDGICIQQVNARQWHQIYNQKYLREWTVQES